MRRNIYLKLSLVTLAALSMISCHVIREGPSQTPGPQLHEEGFTQLFNGKDLSGWTGNTQAYLVEDGNIVIWPVKGGGNLYTENEFADFIFRFEFKLTPGANTGLGIRAPLTGDAAYVGYELQIIDNTAPVYANLEPNQYHGSFYGIIPAKRGFLKHITPNIPGASSGQLAGGVY